MRVVNPQQGIINFGYDPLGRRVYKEAKGVRTNWLWDGNVPLHEWKTTKQEPLINIITWVFEDGTFVPTARITDRGSESIVSDYLGTPIEAYNEDGTKVWGREIDIYGRIRKENLTNFVPYLYQGQYFDSDISLCYNRFRWYDQSIGNYISQDPIGLAGGNPTLYGYVKDVNSWVDVFGLECDTKKLRQHAKDARAHINSLPNQGMTDKQLESIKRSMKRYADTGDARHLSIAERKKKMYVGQRMDAEFKSRVRADESLSHLHVTRVGERGPDVIGKDGKWWDLTTQKDWSNHQKRYGEGGTGLFWD